MKLFAAMIDCSRNAVMRVGEVKKFTSLLKKLGYNALMLYTEDTYEVEGEPYFGYMRGRYSKTEIKEIVTYCDSIGMEVIPCIQTLAHMNQIFRWADYRDICDTADILLAGEERTYELIEHMICTLRKCFSSQYLHIGMDEADMLGLGKYLDKHGEANRMELLTHHLEQVIKIVEKYGFKPIMWSDMFFRLANHGEYYPENPSVSKKIMEITPKQVGLVYWDYCHEQKEVYDKMFDAHLQFENEVWFAGGACTWTGFAPGNEKTFQTMFPAMQSAREHRIEHVMMTLWGDNGKECSYYAALPGLFAVKKFYDGETDMEKIKDEFQKITGEDFDAFCALDLPNYIGGSRDFYKDPCKYMLYSDPFSGYLDATVQEGVAAEYEDIARKLETFAEKSKYAYIFESEAALCRLLTIKYSLGKRTRDAYQSGNKELLAKLVKDYEEAEELLERFYRAFQALWYRENKPQGFEVQDIRLGGLARRLRSCREYLIKYLDREVDRIPELEEKLLPFYVHGKALNQPETVQFNCWMEAASVNVI